jgi:hypothetical protein
MIHTCVAPLSTTFESRLGASASSLGIAVSCACGSLPWAINTALTRICDDRHSCLLAKLKKKKKLQPFHFCLL